MPFTREQFFEVFAAYDAAFWPAAVVAYVLAAAGVFALLWQRRWAGRFVSLVLAAMWGWTAIAYHLAFFADINPAAFGFGAVFLVQAVLLFHYGVVKDRIVPSSAHGWRSVLGWALVGYAALVYPAIGLLAGHPLLGLPLFGVTPCPVTLFTLGLFFLMQSVPNRVLAVPFVWALIGGSAALMLGVPQDVVLLMSAFTVPLLVRWPKRKVSTRLA